MELKLQIKGATPIYPYHKTTYCNKVYQITVSHCAFYLLHHIVYSSIQRCEKKQTCPQFSFAKYVPLLFFFFYVEP